jgi:sugar phosphate isomerase/epimerase
MLATSDPRLLATCWTSAGDAAPQVGDERSPLDMGERMRTAVGAGWSGFGIVHADLVAYRDAHGLESLAALARNSGVERLELEFIGDWWTTGARREASDRVRRDLLDAAEALAVPTIKVAVALEETPPEDLLLTELDRLATEARERGTRVALEPMPFSTSVRTLEDGVRILDALGNPAAGLCVDIWHVFRAGTPYDTIPALLDRDRIFIVELDDGASQPEGTLWSDTVDRRRYPGEGDFDVPAFINAVRATGFDDFWGVEIISEAHRGRPITESLPDVARATLGCFSEASRTADSQLTERTRP